MTNLILLLLLISFIIYITNYYRVENFCAIQYSNFDRSGVNVCDNFCQRAKLDLCVTYKRAGIKVPPECNY